MKTIEIGLSCCLCAERIVVTALVPDEWVADDMDAEGTLCPKHATIEEFRSSQCSGCVGGWTDCTLWRMFAYEHPPKEGFLTETDFRSMEKGICPQRTNGTFMVGSEEGSIKDIDLRDAPNSVAGKALVRAIKEYWEEYNFPHAKEVTAP